MRTFHDPTAGQAIGSVTREWKRQARLAARIRRDPYSEWSKRQSRQFQGIYRRLLTDPPELLAENLPEGRPEA